MPFERKKRLRHPLPSFQLLLAGKAKQCGVQIKWDRRRGTPLSIRGPHLERHQGFSTGKGVTSTGSKEQEAVAVLNNLSGLYGIQEAGTEFTPTPSERDGLGFHHVRLAQVYRGLRVIGGQLIVHFNTGGEAYEVNGHYVSDIHLAGMPDINAVQAVQAARDDLIRSGKSAGTVMEGPELIVFALNVEPKLAYELTLAESDRPESSRWRYWMDAREGTILLRFNDLPTISAPTENGSYSIITGSRLINEGGNLTSLMGWYENTGCYYLHNANRGWTIYNVAINGYSDNDSYAYRLASDWGTSDRCEISAADHFNTIQHYYSMVHGRNSYNNSNTCARVNVHYGVNVVNAFWSPLYQQFFFGNGNGRNKGSGLIAYPLTVLDVCGHEFTHAVTEYSANLLYYYEPGALNESFSDILGACIEFYAQPDGRAAYPSIIPSYADWLMGEDCWVSATALRDMKNPASTVTLGEGSQQPSRYRGTYWYSGTDDNGGVHINSGVQNFFFYLLCEGGSGDNDGLPYHVTGISISNAEQIAYRALTVYLTKYIDYPEARSAWISAALDLNTNWVCSVTQAWSAVGVEDPPVCETLEDTLNAPSLTWQTGGSADWFTEYEITHDGMAAAQSGALTDNQNSWLSTTVHGWGTLSFWWQVSSEIRYDYVRFYIDNREQTNISGKVDWQYQSFAIPSGTHTLTWRYTKDGSFSSGSDAGWLDQVTWTPVTLVAASDGTYRDKIVVTWTPIAGATTYELWRAVEAPHDISQADLLATTTSTNYPDLSAIPAYLYEYWIRAQTPEGTTDFSASDTGWRSWLTETPTHVTATDGTYVDKVRVSWAASVNATRYEIWRNTMNDVSSAYRLAESTETNYDDTSETIRVGSVLYYWVKAKNAQATSDFSQSDNGYCGVSDSYISGNADLSIGSFLFLPAVVNPGGHPDRVAIVLTNHGPAHLESLNTRLYVDFYLSSNSTWGDSDDQWMGDYGTDLTLRAGSSQSGMIPISAITIPADASGNYYVFAKVRHAWPSSLNDPFVRNNIKMRSGTIAIGNSSGASYIPVSGDFDGDERPRIRKQQACGT